MERDREPSRGAILMALLAIGLVGASFVLPWWSFDSSTGRQTAEGGPQDAEDTRVEKHSLDYLPFRLEGDQQASDQEGAEQGVLQLGIAASVAGGGMLLFLLFEFVRFLRPFPRGISLAVSALAAIGLVAGLGIAFLLLPLTMSGDGVGWALTDRLLDTHYIRTTLGLGWVAAALAIPAVLGALAFRFQAGSHDPAAVEAYA